MSNLTSSLLKISVLIGGCLTAGQLFAEEIGTIAPADVLPRPGVSIEGMGGNGWTAIGDIMAPLFGGPARFVYLDPQFYYHSNPDSYTGSLGAGFRRLTEHAGILGAYVFGDYNRSSDGHDFWFVSPGVERLGQMWDFSVNGYIPVSSQRINTGTELAGQAGDTSQVSFAGHTQYDALVNTFVSTGYGGDAQVGVRLPFLKNSEIYFGGYYFAPKDTDTIGGGAVRLQVPLNRYLNVLFSEAYDSEYHNTIKAGLTLWFGGRHTEDGFHGDLVERMVAPIQRNLVIVAGGSGTGQPAVSDFTDSGQTAIALQNISFFVPGPESKIAADAPTISAAAASGDGTYENPYVGMSQDNVDKANVQNNRNFYIESGTYAAAYGVTDPNYIVLNNDRLFGRQNGFTQAAQGAARPVIIFSEGGFEIPAGDVYDSITGLQLAGADAAGHAGIWIHHADSPLDQAATINNTAVQAFGDGLDILNSGAGTLRVTINNAWISDNNGSGELFDTFQTLGGVAAVNADAGALQVNLNRSTISNNTKLLPENSFLEAVGGLASVNEGVGTMDVDVYRSTLSENEFAINSISFFSQNQVDAIGGLASVNQDTGWMTVRVNRSTLSDNTVTVNSGDRGLDAVKVAGGLAVLNNDGTGTTDVNVDDSVFSGNLFSFTGGGRITSFSVGGLAAVNAGFEGAEMTVYVDHSTISGNITASHMTEGNGTFSGQSFYALGGLAVSNLGHNSTMAVETSHLKITDNAVSLNDYNVTGFSANDIYAVGGMAVVSSDGTMTLDVDHSTISENEIAFNNQIPTEQVIAAGGLALASLINQQDGTLTVNIHDSTISQNILSFNEQVIFARFYTNGGLAAFDTGNGTMVLNIDHSTVAQNAISFDDHDSPETIYSAGGLAVTNFSGDATMIVNMSHSSIEENTASFAGSAQTIYATGGVAVISTNVVPMTVDINTSTITSNSPGGVGLYGGDNLALTLDRSTVAGNGDFALTASGGATAAVTHPVFFDGIVNAASGSAVTFPGIPFPITSDGVHVTCLTFTSCQITP